jgi:7,8-dihydropterin-6-yl-methyl-4-(beta-D-ribofuranosyl)aminobenzene 5'-phosphate synthase
MTITILTDNTPGDDKELKSEHGFSAYIQTNHTNVLCDMGASDAFMYNSQKLGIYLDTIDFAFISHGHSDHTGGLQVFFDKVKDKDIYIPHGITSEKYYSLRHESKRDISTILSDEANNSHRLKFISESKWLSQDMAVIKNVYDNYSKPNGNRHLYKATKGLEVEDDFSHEQSLAITTKKGLVIISPCSHCGITNIMKSCCLFTGQSNVYAFIGGLHIVDDEKTEQESEKIISEISKEFPETLIITGHCTCNRAKDVLKSKSNNIMFFKTGSSFSEDMFAI